MPGASREPIRTKVAVRWLAGWLTLLVGSSYFAYSLATLTKPSDSGRLPELTYHDINQLRQEATGANSGDGQSYEFTFDGKLPPFGL